MNSSTWKKTILADVALVDPETISGGGQQLIDYISLEDVSQGKILGSTRMRLSTAPSRARRRIKSDDFIFGTVRPNLRSHAQYRGGLTNPVASTGFAVVRAIPGKASADYLAQWLLSDDVSRQVERLIAGSNYPAVSSRDVRQFEIALPELSTQRQIAQILKDTDELIYILERLIAKKKSVRQGLMQQLLTGRSRLPHFTGDWDKVRLGDHVSYIKTVALSRAQLDDTSPLRYLHYGDIHTSQSARLDAFTQQLPRATATLAGRAGRLLPGDLVFADASEDPAGVGKSVEIMSVPKEGLVPGLHTIAARFNKKVLADGFKAYLQFVPDFRESLLRLAAGTKVLATTRSYISSITLSLPNIDEQQAIASVLADSDDEIFALQARLVKAQAIKTGMMQQLLTGRTQLPVEIAP